MNTLIILFAIVFISIVLIYIGLRGAEQVDENDLPIRKFQPRQITDLSKPEAPKRKYYKRRNKKKKPAVAENTIVEKRPVGRPKKSN